jgi:hypothetical protein
MDNSNSKSSIKVKASSIKAQNGSSKSGHKTKSHSHSSSSHKHFHSTQIDKGATVKRFILDERDHRSFAVKDFDAHQAEARRKHEEVLRDVVGMRYD